MQTLQFFLDFILHIDQYLFSFVANYGDLTYLALFLIIFCETGLVITPFLPGDSLLFVAGSIAANPSSSLDINLLFLLLVLASTLGNKLNYLIGRFFGRKLFTFDNQENSLRSKLLNKKHLEQTHDFYQRHGGKTLIIARFIPIIRTFAPFVAGIGYMSLKEFALYNISSALLWIGSLLAAGYYFGALPLIRDNFSIAIYGIIAFSLAPAFFAFLQQKMRNRA